MSTPALSKEFRLATVIGKALDSYSFDSFDFARYVTNKHIRVQMALFDAFLACIKIWAMRYDDNEWDTEDGMNLFAKAKRIQDFQDKYSTPRRKGTRRRG